MKIKLKTTKVEKTSKDLEHLKW